MSLVAGLKVAATTSAASSSTAAMSVEASSAATTSVAFAAETELTDNATKRLIEEIIISSCYSWFFSPLKFNYWTNKKIKNNSILELKIFIWILVWLYFLDNL